MKTDTQHTHIDAAELVRLVDGQLAADARGEVERAVASCDVCRANARRTVTRSRRLADALAGEDVAPPGDALARIEAATRARRARRYNTPARGARVAAAVALLLLAGALLTTPLAAWLADAAGRTWSALAGDGLPPDPTAAPGSVAEGTTVERSYEYAPAAGPLAIRFAAGTTGTLQLEAVDEDRLVLDAVGATDDVLLLPTGIRVTSATDAAAFRLRVPAQVTAVNVHVGNGPPIRVSRAAIAAGGVRVDLQ